MDIQFTVIVAVHCTDSVAVHYTVTSVCTNNSYFVCTLYSVQELNSRFGSYYFLQGKAR